MKRNKKSAEQEPIHPNLRFEWIDPSTGQANPLNYRVHPPHQTEALKALIYDERDVGWAGVALLNERRVEDGWSKADAVPTFIDGHDRRELALKNGGKLPTLIGHWSPAGEKKILAFLDPIGKEAVTDPSALESLLAGIETESGALLSMLNDIGRDLEATKLHEPESSWLDGGKQKTGNMVVTVRPVITVKDVEIFEQAMKATGERNRASALMILARAYLEKSKGQFNLRPEGTTPETNNYGAEFDLGSL